ncbi:MAG: tail fiber domain-containing protein, partial [Candidatus Omnitrophica bacterium]|nr:tail fiber domain-containing protein [Candidatus Omnitrophota bacterium]
MPRLLRIVISGLLFLFPVMLLAEEITITSYYPSPYGVYNELRAKKMAIGDDYIDSGDYTWESSDGDGGEVDYNADLVVEGNVGIGTTTPVSKLVLLGGGMDIGAQSATDQTVVDSINKGKGSEITFWAPCEGYSNLAMHNGGRIYTKMPAADWGQTQLVLQAGNDWNKFVSQQFVLVGNGNVGVGTNSPGYKLHVVGDIYASGSISATGGCVCTSDKRFKKNIVILDNSLRKILRLKGVKFDWRQKEFKDKNFVSGRQIGIIAQEMEKEFPELVMTDKEGYKSIAYDKFTAVLLEAIKEQENKINSQQAVIKSL